MRKFVITVVLAVVIGLGAQLGYGHAQPAGEIPIGLVVGGCIIWAGLMILLPRGP